MKNPNSSVRRATADSLGKIGDARFVKALIGALQDPDPSVRCAVVNSLGKMGDVRVVRPLLNACVESSSEISKTIYKAICLIGNPAVDVLVGVFRQGSDRHQRAAATALNMLKWKPADKAELLKFYMATKQYMQCAELGEMSVELLIKASREEDITYDESMIYALGRTGDRRAVKPLVEVLKNGCRPSVCYALEIIGDLEAAEVVLTVLLKVVWHEAGSRPLKRFPKLFGDYADIIFEIGHVMREGEWGPPTLKYNHPSYTYPLDKSNAAIGRLCRIRTAMSNNILHLVKQKPDFHVQFSYGCLTEDDIYGTLSYENQRKITSRELQARGNPPYNKAAFLDPKEWKLKIT